MAPIWIPWGLCSCCFVGQARSFRWKYQTLQKSGSSKTKGGARWQPKFTSAGPVVRVPVRVGTCVIQPNWKKPMFASIAGRLRRIPGMSASPNSSISTSCALLAGELLNTQVSSATREILCLWPSRNRPRKSCRPRPSDGLLRPWTDRYDEPKVVCEYRLKATTHPLRFT